MKSNLLTLLAAAVLCGPSICNAAPTLFDSFTPLASSVTVGSLPEATPFQLSSPNFHQRTIADRATQQGLGQFNSGNWDMHTTNETGPDAGRYLFTPFETSRAGIQRTDLVNGTTTTVWSSPASAPALNSQVAFDASRWTPWGSYLTAEESWRSSTSGASIYGRVFELTNPTTATGPVDANIVHRNIIPRVSHEGLTFDKNKNFYYVDELNGGSLYKFTSDNPNATSGNDYFAAGTNSVLRVGDGNTANATGAFTWIDFADENGAFAGGVNYTDLNGVTSADGRFTTNVAAYKGTDYQRPEDLEVQTLANGDQRLYVATTSTNEVYSLNLATNEINVFASRNTINAATGLAVGNELTSPDNLAIDAAGNLYIIEDQPGGVADIWFATDADRDGVAESIGRWASMSTTGAEPTGLYFDPFNPNRAWVNVQHPSSGVDRTIEITAIPEPATLSLMGVLIVGWVGIRRRK